MGIDTCILVNRVVLKRCTTPQAVTCAAGDSSAYERKGSSLDDVVIVSALRTPICKVCWGCRGCHSVVNRSVFAHENTSPASLHHPQQAKRGWFKDTPVDDLLAAVLKATIDRTGINPAVCVCRQW